MIEKVVIIKQIPYSLSKNITKFFDKKEIKIAFAYITILVKPNDNVYFERVLDSIKGLGKKTLKSITDYANRNKISIYETCKMVTTDSMQAFFAG